MLNNIGGRATVTREFGRPVGRHLAAPATTLSFTYANECEDYKVSEETLADPDLPGRPDCARPRSRTGPGQRTALVDLPRGGRNTTTTSSTPTRYVAAVHLEQAGQMAWRRLRLLRVTAEARHYCRSPARAGGGRPRRGGSIDWRGDTRNISAVLQAVFPRRRHQPARMGTLRGGAADEEGLADRRPVVHELLDRSPGADLEQSRRGPVRSTPATSGPIPGTSTSTICATTSGRGSATTRRSGRFASTSGTSSIRFPG